MQKLNLDPRLLKDWQIAEAYEGRMKPVHELAAELGLQDNEVIPMGRNLAKIDAPAVFKRLSRAVPKGKYINVTAITPTPLGEGKTTTAIGLVQGLGVLGKKVTAAIRQASGGPTFNVKGAAAGGGLAQVIPLTPGAIRLTGDIDAVTNAHNLAMVALTARMQHEHNYDDTRLAKLGLERLDIDPHKVVLKWAMDFCAQALRNIIIGRGGHMDGLEMESGFQISVSSEVMAILAVASDLKDLRQRLARMVVAYSRDGREVTTADLKVDGAMAAWLVDALQPNLLQTLEGQPVFVHAGPFANIAIGQSSIIADHLGLRLADYHITESGFGSDIGFEKFWNLKCRMAGLKPSAAVLVATVRALKMHGGAPNPRPGGVLDGVYTQEDVGLVEKGCENLLAHIEIIKKSGLRPVVAINSFHTDTPAEVAAIKRIAEQAGALAVPTQHWLSGGAGSQELAEAVIAAASEPADFRFLYDNDLPLSQRIKLIAQKVYGAKDVSYTASAQEQLTRLEADPATADLGTCMVKTHLSLSHDPDLKGRPQDFLLPIRDFLVFRGAGFVVPVAGDIKLMPGTASKAAFMNIDVDTDTGRIKGLF